MTQMAASFWTSSRHRALLITPERVHFRTYPGALGVLALGMEPAQTAIIRARRAVKQTHTKCVPSLLEALAPTAAVTFAYQCGSCKLNYRTGDILVVNSPLVVTTSPSSLKPACYRLRLFG
jgi:hypothetical protein